MSPISLARLRHLTRDEITWRTHRAARTAIQRVRSRVQPRHWARRHLFRTVLPGILERSSAYEGEAGWQSAHAELLCHLRRNRRRFVLDPQSRSDLCDAVLSRWPASKQDAAARADRILSGCYDVLGYRGLNWTSDAAIDWHFDPVHKRRAPLRFWADMQYLDPRIGDHKIIWELNRHQHWMQLGRVFWLTGDIRYRQRILWELEGWLRANPPHVGINWASMLEVAFRALSWTWALHFLLADIDDQEPDSPWLVDLFVALGRQLTHVERNLSLYFSPNTHLTGEALALYVVGAALPELVSSSRWTETGRRILLTEIDRQILRDGGHAERSFHYQRYTLDFYLMALLTAERTGDDEATGRFKDAVGRLAEFTRTVADDSGQLPLIGDDDGGLLWPIAGRACSDVRDSLALAALLLERWDLAPWGIQEEVLWIAGQRALTRAQEITSTAPEAAPLSSRMLPDTGYFVGRDRSGNHVVFDAGAHGYLNGGHAHADALSLTITLGSHRLLIDPGTSTYTTDARLRDILRSTMSHNTITLGSRSQSVPAGPFHWKTRADAHLHEWRGNAGFDWIEGSHDGYVPVRHRRTLVRTAQSGWLVIDEILGRSSLTASAHWHFDPGWTLTCDGPGRLRAVHVERDEAWLLHDSGELSLTHGDINSGLGWYAPVYGTLIPTWTARITRCTDGPFTMLTWIDRARTPAIPALERLYPTCDSAGAAIGARVTRGNDAAVFLLRPGGPQGRESRGCGVSAYHTDARMLYYTETDGALQTLSLADASHALALRSGWMSIAAVDSIADLHATLAGDVLQLYASTPPPEMCLQGDAVRRVRAIRLNERDLATIRTGRDDTLIVYTSDWGGSVVAAVEPRYLTT